MQSTQSSAYARLIGYDQGLDKFKVLAQQAAAATGNAAIFEEMGWKEVPESRGESTYLVETETGYLAFTIEGLGTKNMIADIAAELFGQSYYQAIAQDTLAMIVNDMLSLGALPLVVGMHLATAEPEWFDDGHRAVALIEGWRLGCKQAGCAWGCGETPVLPGIIQSKQAEISGAASGVIKEKEWRIRGDIESGDAIVMVGSSGVHANGLSLLRKHAEEVGKVARTLPEKFWRQKLDGLTRLALIEDVLQPTPIYRNLIAELSKSGVIRYAIPITGHGWLKLMRHPQPFRYMINDPGTPQVVFGAIQDALAGTDLQMSDEDMYQTYNMGAGYAFIVRPGVVSHVLGRIAYHGYHGWHAGWVEEPTNGIKEVVILPKGIEFSEAQLQIRA
jgi:phosphoribosylformylglycinamidine cyclo-ligase